MCQKNGECFLYSETFQLFFGGFVINHFLRFNFFLSGRSLIRLHRTVDHNHTYPILKRGDHMLNLKESVTFRDYRETELTENIWSDSLSFGILSVLKD